MNVTVTLPSTGKTVSLELNYTAGSCGSYWDPPEAPEIEILGGFSTEGLPTEGLPTEGLPTEKVTAEEIEALTDQDWLVIEDAVSATWLDPWLDTDP